jgi:hypothetical protein
MPGIGDWCKYSMGFYFHHFINIGDGTIVEMIKDNGRIEKNSYPYGQNVIIVKYGDKNTAEKALSYIGTGSYNVLFSNCEQFCDKIFGYDPEYHGQAEVIMMNTSRIISYAVNNSDGSGFYVKPQNNGFSFGFNFTLG